MANITTNQSSVTTLLIIIIGICNKISKQAICGNFRTKVKISADGFINKFKISNLIIHLRSEWRRRYNITQIYVHYEKFKLERRIKVSRLLF